MNDYERVARVIRHLDEHRLSQPDLATLAEFAGLSPFYLHRLFTRWAGITPKNLLRCLTLEHVKTLLREGESVLDASLESGLSGPGRLHDLTVSLEAATPGEWKSGGRDLEITCGVAETPFGECLIGETARGICHLAFLAADEADAEDASLMRQWPEARFVRNDGRAKELAARIFARPEMTPNGLSLRAVVKGTEFQVRVWRALLQIPPGSLVTYGNLASALGKPGAARAVGNAVGQNSVAFLIPCHRVIRETGLSGNYKWGRIRKRAILAWETAEKALDDDENGGISRELLKH